MKIEQLIVYPVKSLRGISLDVAQVEKRGLQYDRRWMLTDLDGKFISQRSYPVLALIEVAIEADKLKFTYPDSSPASLEIAAFPLQKGPLLDTMVFDKKCKALPVSELADEWFSKILGSACRLVYMPEESKRLVNQKHAGSTDIVSFADGYPVLVANTASLTDLNERLEVAVPMNRFRPNIVISGENPFGEDHWEHYKINGVHFRGVKPCARCTMTTVDQSKGIKSGAEPLKTLSTYRKEGNKVLFGLNSLWMDSAWEAAKGVPVLRVGNLVEVLERKGKD